MPLYFPATDRRLLKAATATSSATSSTTELVVFQYLFPAGSWPVGQMVRIEDIWASKSGTTHTGTLKLKMGTLGTTSDTQILSATALSAANREFRGDATLRLESATSVQAAGGNSSGFQQGTANAAQTAVTITSMAANAIYLSLTLTSSGSDTLTLGSASLWLVGRSP